MSGRHTTLREIKEDMKFIRKIGAGGQGKTELFERRGDGKRLIRKSYFNNVPGRLPHEGFMLSNYIAPHPRILKVEGFQRHPDGSRANLFFQYCEGGDLHQVIQKHGRGMPEQFVWHVLVQMAEALAFLHYGIGRSRTQPDSWKSVMHTDIKPDNIFFLKKVNFPNEVPRLVLGDFGLATLSKEFHRKLSPAYWNGPEWPLTTPASDIWGVGAIIHKMCHFKAPVDPKPAHIPTRQWDENPNAKNPLPLPERYSEPLNRLMMTCLRRDPYSRISSLELLEYAERGRDTYCHQQPLL